MLSVNQQVGLEGQHSQTVDWHEAHLERRSFYAVFPKARTRVFDAD